MPVVFKEENKLTKEEVKKLIGHDLPYVVDAIIAKNLSEAQINEIRKALDAITKYNSNSMTLWIFEEKPQVAALLADPKYTGYFRQIGELTKMNANNAIERLKYEPILNKFKEKPAAVVRALGDIQGDKIDDSRSHIFQSIGFLSTKTQALLDYCDGKITTQEYLDRLMKNRPER